MVATESLLDGNQLSLTLLGCKIIGGVAPNILDGRKVSKLTASNIVLYYLLPDWEKKYDEDKNSHPFR
jgi:hypothetical protein